MANFRVPVLESFAWQEPVLAIVNEPALSTKGTRYIVGDLPVGDFAAATPGDVAWKGDTIWFFDRPAVGWKVYNVAINSFYVYANGAWSSASIMDGLTLTGDVKSDNDAIDWDLLDNDAAALTFNTATDVNMLNFDTRDGAEVLSTDAVLKLNNDVDLTTGAVDVDLTNATNALTFSYDSTSILTIDATNRKVTVDKDMTIVGDLIVQGSTTTIQTTELVVEDKLITLNKGGIATSAGGAGIEFEEAGVAAGFFKVSSDRNDLEFQAPANDFTFTLDIDANSELNMLGNLTVEAASFIDQDLTQDSTVAKFAKLTLTGDLDLAAGGVVTVAAASATALNVNSGLFVVDTLNSAVKTNGALDVTGITTLRGNIVVPNSISAMLQAASASALSFDSSSLVGVLSIDTLTNTVNFGNDLAVVGDAFIEGDVNVSATSKFTTNGTDGVTVAEAQTSYDTRAQYDSVLKVMVFVEPDTYVA